MKKLFSIIAILMCLLLSSCDTYATVQSEDVYMEPNVDVSVVIRYGTPIYVGNVLSYYVYNGYHYYPYRNHWRMRPAPPPSHRHHFDRGIERPRSHANPNPRIHDRKPSHSSPNHGRIGHGSSTRHGGHGHFGGRR